MHAHEEATSVKWYLCRIESMKRDLMAAQQSAALAIQDKTVCERAAAEKLQDAHQQLENEQQVRRHASNDTGNASVHCVLASWLIRLPVSREDLIC